MKTYRVGVKKHAGFLLALVVLAWGSGLLLASDRLSLSIGLASLAVLCAGRALTRADRHSVAGAVVPVWEQVRREIERARRHNRSLVVARLTLEPAGMDNPYPIAEQAEYMLRATDSVWVENRSILLLLSEVDRHSAQVVVDRLVESLTGLVTESILASFPEDELTLGGLMDRLYPSRRIRPVSDRGVKPMPVPVRVVETEQQATA